MTAEEVFGSNLIGMIYKMEDEEHAYFLSSSMDNKYVAAVFGNGALRIMEPNTLQLLARSIPGKPYDDLPCTCVRWLPDVIKEGKTTTYQLITVSSAGGVLGWQWDEAELICYKKVEEKGNEIATMDISPDGTLFMTAGRDRIVRLYNAQTFELVSELKKGVDEDGSPRTTHKSRIFSARFVTSTLAASAGWESPLQLWDLRTLRSEREILGAQGSSDSVEPIAKSRLLLFSDGKATPKLRVLDPISCSERTEETRIINAHLTSSDHVITSRFSHATSSIWAVCTSPNKLINISITSGEILGKIDLPFPPLNLFIMDLNETAVYVTCHNGRIVRVRRA